jgi:hypothetical protein
MEAKASLLTYQIREGRIMKTQSKTNQVFRGIARNVNYQDINHVCTFRLERQDENGDIAGYNVVEIYNVVTDIAAEGDNVEVIGKLREGTIYPNNVYNLTTGKTLNSGWQKWILLIPAFGFTLIILWWIFVFFLPRSITSDLNNCTIYVERQTELRSKPSHSDGYKVGELAPEASYPATQRARSLDGFSGTWFYVEADGVQGWLDPLGSGFTAVGDCGD